MYSHFFGTSTSCKMQYWSSQNLHLLWLYIPINATFRNFLFYHVFSPSSVYRPPPCLRKLCVFCFGNRQLYSHFSLAKHFSLPKWSSEPIFRSCSAAVRSLRICCSFALVNERYFFSLTCSSSREMKCKETRTRSVMREADEQVRRLIVQTERSDSTLSSCKSGKANKGVWGEDARISSKIKDFKSPFSCNINLLVHFTLAVWVLVKSIFYLVIACCTLKQTHKHIHAWIL